jgi:hypothetical protein
MKHLKTSLILFLLFIHASAFSQTQTPAFGLELSGSFRKVDVNSWYDKTPVFGNYIGFYTQVPLTGHFSVKFGAGLNQVFVRCDEVKGFWEYDPEKPVIYPAKSITAYTLSAGIEPRYYLFPASRPWGNLYAALPVTFETSPVAKEYVARNELKIIPGIGYRYEINRRWAIEAGAGLGWGAYFTPKENANYGWKSSALEHTVALRLGYTF